LLQKASRQRRSHPTPRKHVASVPQSTGAFCDGLAESLTSTIPLGELRDPSVHVRDLVAYGEVGNADSICQAVLSWQKDCLLNARQ